MLELKLQYDLFTILDLLVDKVLQTPDRDRDLDLDRRLSLRCADGYTVSVQMGLFNYCSPRVSGLRSSEYTSAELGYPTEPDDLIDQYAEDKLLPTESVYCKVPMYTVQKLFLKHGGLHPTELIRLTKIQKQQQINSYRYYQTEEKNNRKQSKDQND
tara:strand:- start:5786 stop:6256 length:471 start_codon:yes stop_codon:yes gene_type:complete